VVSASFLIDAESNLKAALADLTPATTSAKSANTYQAVGNLDAVDGREVTITHQPIPALNWPGMTMDFELVSPDLVKGVQLGSPIRFEFEQRGPGEFVITRIESTGTPKAKLNGAN
jgi:Cu(I)/Ag(I) efflux system membrane fusion protein